MIAATNVTTVIAFGITAETFVKVGGIVIKRVRFGSDLGSYFDLDFDGTDALIIGCINGDHLLDFVATDIKQPNRFARMERRIWWLGQNFDYYDISAPLPVWRNPLTWLRNGADGIVILDWGAAFWHLNHRKLIAEDEAHGRQIRKLMQQPKWQGCVMLRKETTPEEAPS